MVRTFAEDYRKGKENELNIETINIIETAYADTLEVAQSPTCRYDYKGASGYLYELKTRTVASNRYETTLIPAGKILKDGRHRFVFAFTDGVYAIQYDPTLFNTFELKPFCRSWRADFKDKPALYYYIPVDRLKRISV